MTAKELREARETAGLSMAEAARLTGEKYRTWQSWEDDGPNGRPPRAIAFAWIELYAKLKRLESP